jgi:sulfur transfer complex TusBCD TusB component (DsrH family)
MEIDLKRVFYVLLIVLGLGLFLSVGSIMPRITTELFASPDETAVMVFARAWEFGEGFRLPHGLPEQLEHFQSFHPRSMIRQGDYLVPVGFLGMPLIISFVEMLGQGLGAYLTLILVLSAIYPLWRLAKKTNPRVAIITVFIFLTFPTILLYVNRGLFPNLPVVALTIWAVWALAGVRRWEKASVIRAVIGGISVGLAFIIRPVEAVWIIPWVAWAIWLGLRTTKNELITTTKRFLPYVIAGAIALLICFYGVYLAMQTYPYHSNISDQPVIGYLLGDRVDARIIEGTPAAFVEYTEPAAVREGWEKYFPFGFHPRVMWENIRVFLLGYLGIWTGVAFFGAFVSLRKRWNKDSFIFLALVGWTFLSLLIFYGQALYSDNIRGNPSLGNSFLRYMLPLVPIIAYGCARLIDEVWSKSIRGRILGVSAVIFFLLFGTTIAFANDEEGILQTQYELQRYSLIRSQAEHVVKKPGIIISERSDKIFASGPFVTVSPMPSDEDLDELTELTDSIYMFHRTFDGGLMENRIQMYYGDSLGLFTLNNETFYQLIPAIFEMTHEEIDGDYE